MCKQISVKPPNIKLNEIHSAILKFYMWAEMVKLIGAFLVVNAPKNGSKLTLYVLCAQ
jgi:hypothetical protein